MSHDLSCYVCHEPMEESNSIKLLKLPTAVDCHKKCMNKLTQNTEAENFDGQC